MATKVNIVLDDDVKADLDRLVSAGKRSRVINIALRRELDTIRRRSASTRLDALRAKSVAVTDDSIVKRLRRDRQR